MIHFIETTIVIANNTMFKLLRLTAMLYLPLKFWFKKNSVSFLYTLIRAMVVYTNAEKIIGKTLLICTKLQNSYTAIRRKIPNKTKKLSVEKRIEASNNSMYTVPEIARFKVSFIIINLLKEVSIDF